MKGAMSVVAFDDVPCWSTKTAKKQDEEPTKKSDSEGTQKDPKTAKKQDEEPTKKAEGTQKERHTIVCIIPVGMTHTRLRRKQPACRAWVLAGLGATPKAAARPADDDGDVDAGQAIHNLMRELFPCDTE